MVALVGGIIFYHDAALQQEVDDAWRGIAGHGMHLLAHLDKTLQNGAVKHGGAVHALSSQRCPRMA